MKKKRKTMVSSKREDNTAPNEFEVYDQDGEYDEHDLPLFVRGKKAAAEVLKRAAVQKLKETRTSSRNKVQSKFWDSGPNSAKLAKEISRMLGNQKLGDMVPATFPAAVGRLGARDGWTIGAKMETRKASLNLEDCAMVERMLREANTNPNHPDRNVAPGKNRPEGKTSHVIGAVEHGEKVKTFSFPLKLRHDDRRIVKVVAVKCKQAYNAWVRAWSLTHRCSTSSAKELETILEDCWMNGVCVCS
jgi:hypothetical protein